MNEQKPQTTNTVSLLMWASAALLFIGVTTFYMPRVPESVRTMIFGQFQGCFGAFLLALQTTNKPPNPPAGGSPA